MKQYILNKGPLFPGTPLERSVHYLTDLELSLGKLLNSSAVTAIKFASGDAMNDAKLELSGKTNPLLWSSDTLNKTALIAKNIPQLLKSDLFNGGLKKDLEAMQEKSIADQDQDKSQLVKTTLLYLLTTQEILWALSEDSQKIQDLATLLKNPEESPDSTDENYSKKDIATAAHDIFERYSTLQHNSKQLLENLQLVQKS